MAKNKLVQAILRVKKPITELGGRKLFNGSATFTDLGEARELEKEYGKKGTNEFTFAEIPDWREGHRPISMRVPELPWKKENK